MVFSPWINIVRFFDSFGLSINFSPKLNISRNTTRKQKRMWIDFLSYLPTEKFIWLKNSILKKQNIQCFILIWLMEEIVAFFVLLNLNFVFPTKLSSIIKTSRLTPSWLTLFFRSLMILTENLINILSIKGINSESYHLH